MTAKKVLLSVTETFCNPFVQKLGFLVFAGNIPHFTKDYFGPKSTQSIFLVDRPHICETIGNLLTIRDNHLGRSEKVWRNRLSHTRVEYRKKDQNPSAACRFGRQRVL